MLEMSELIREFEEDTNTVDRAVEEIARISIDDRDEIESFKNKVRTVLQSETLSAEEEQKAHLMLEVLDTLQGCIGQWPSIPKLVGALEVASKPDGEYLSADEMGETRSQLIEALALVVAFFSNAVSGRFETPKDLFLWIKRTERSLGGPLLQESNLEADIEKILLGAPPEVLAVEPKKMVNLDLVRFFTGLELILATYLKWINRILQMQLSIAQQDLSETEKAQVEKKLGQIIRWLQKRAPAFVEKLFTEYIPKMIANFMKTRWGEN